MRPWWFLSPRTGMTHLWVCGSDPPVSSRQQPWDNLLRCTTWCSPYQPWPSVELDSFVLLSWILKWHLVVTIKRANAFPIGDPILPRTDMIRRRVFDGYPPLSSRPRVADSPSRYTTTSHPSLLDPLLSLDLFALQFLILPQKIIQKWICSD